MRNPMAQKKQTILVVEDEKLLRKPLCKVLELQGYNVLEANSGTAALQIWAQHKADIDLLLTDVMMPDYVNGFLLAEKLRADKPDLKVIFSTGHGKLLEDSGMSLRGSANYLQKPYDPQKLIATIKANLNPA
jgi:CheY-like chemotaxis protein